MKTLNADRRELLERLYEEFSDRMYKIAFSILHSQQDAEDAVAEAFLKIANNLDKLKDRPGRDIQGFCAVVTQNTAKDFRRKNSLRDGLFTELNEDISAMKSELDLCEVSELKEAIRLLNDDQKQALLLYYIYGLTVKNIADIQNVAAITVYKRIQTAVQYIKNTLGKGDER